MRKPPWGAYESSVLREVGGRVFVLTDFELWFDLKPEWIYNYFPEIKTLKERRA